MLETQNYFVYHIRFPYLIFKVNVKKGLYLVEVWELNDRMWVNSHNCIRRHYPCIVISAAFKNFEWNITVKLSIAALQLKFLSFSFRFPPSNFIRFCVIACRTTHFQFSRNLLNLNMFTTSKLFVNEYKKEKGNGTEKKKKRFTSTQIEKISNNNKNVFYM